MTDEIDTTSKQYQRGLEIARRNERENLKRFCRHAGLTDDKGEIALQPGVAGILQAQLVDRFGSQYFTHEIAFNEAQLKELEEKHK